MAQPPHRVEPVCFDDVKEMADRFLSGQAVLVYLRGSSSETARRIIDFGSGMCYSTGGTLERMNGQEYLLTPLVNPPQDPDSSPLGPGGPPLPASGAAALLVEDRFFTDAVSTKKVG